MKTLFSIFLPILILSFSSASGSSLKQKFCDTLEFESSLKEIEHFQLFYEKKDSVWAKVERGRPFENPRFVDGRYQLALSVDTIGDTGRSALGIVAARALESVTKETVQLYRNNSKTFSNSTKDFDAKIHIDNYESSLRKTNSWFPLPVPNFDVFSEWLANNDRDINRIDRYSFSNDNYSDHNFWKTALNIGFEKGNLSCVKFNLGHHASAKVLDLWFFIQDSPNDRGTMSITLR